MKTTKKILSLILAAALLLGTVAIAANAEGLTAYEGSVLTYTATTDKTVNGVTEVKPGETIKVSVYLTTNYYTGATGGEIFLWTKAAFEDLGSNYSIKNFGSNFDPTIGNPTAAAAFNSTEYPSTTYTGFNIVRGYNADRTVPVVLNNELVYEFNLTVKNDESLVGTTATFAMPEANVKTTDNPGRKGIIYQAVNDNTDSINSAHGYSESVNLFAPITINIVSAEEPAVPCNYDALNAAVAKYDDLVESEYTPNSWSASDVVAAATAAKGVDKNLTVDEAGANQKTIDDAAAALEAAIAKLVKKADKSALKVAIDTVVDTENCTSASVAAYTEAKAEAEDVYADPNASQDAVNAATDKLTTAIANVKKLDKCDYTALDAAIALVPEKDKEYYNADDYAAWEAALAAAKAVERDMYADEAGVNQAAIKAAADELTEAYNKLAPSTLDITVLTDAIAASTTPEYAEEYYDATAYAAWEAALAAAQAGVTEYTGKADTAANRDAVKALADDLTAKFAALEPAFVNLDELKKVIDDCDTPAYAEEYYNADAYADWSAALAKAQDGVTTYTGAADTSTNRISVEFLIDDLTSAYEALVPAFLDLTALNNAIAASSSPAYAEEYYDAAAYAAWQAALDAAKNGVIEYDGAADTEANREAVAALAADLTAKFAALEAKTVDLTALNNAIAASSSPAYAEKYYDAAAYAAWEAALAAAQAGVTEYDGKADTEANREAVAALAADLTAKFAALEPQFLDYSPLKKALDDCKAAYPESYYTPETWDDYSKTCIEVTNQYEYFNSQLIKLPDTQSNRNIISREVARLTEAYNALQLKESLIISVTPLRTDYTKNDVVNFEVEVEGVNASKLQFVTSTGKTITVDKKSPDFVSVTTNEAGNEVWTVAVRIYTDEDATMLVRAKVGNIWDNGYFAFELKPTGKADYSVKSAVVTLNDSEVDTFTVKDTVSLVITTGADVTKVRLVNQATGSTATYSTPASVNVDGTKVWVVTKKYGTAKDYAFDVYTRGLTQAWADSNVDLAFSVTAAPVPQVPSTGIVEDAIFSASVGAARIFRGDTQVFTVVTDKDAKEVRILNSKGDVVVESTVGVVDGATKTWTIDRVYNVDGTYNYTVEALYGNTWHKDADGELSFVVAY